MINKYVAKVNICRSHFKMEWDSDFESPNGLQKCLQVDVMSEKENMLPVENTKIRGNTKCAKNHQNTLNTWNQSQGGTSASWRPSSNMTNDAKITVGISMRDKRTTLDWLMQQNVIASPVSCKICGNDMKVVPCTGLKAKFGWSPLVEGQQHDVVKSLHSGSWFSKSNLTLYEILLLTYYWAHDLPHACTEH